MTDQIPSQDVFNADQEIKVEPLSITDKFIGVLSEPSATFENVRAAGSRSSDWLVPVLLLCILGAIAAYIVTTNPTMKESILEKTREQMYKQIAAGQMKQEQADQAIEMTERFMMPFGVAAALIGTPIKIFFMVLIYWLLIKFALRSVTTYTILLSVYGLVIYIDLINQLLSLIISMATGNIYASISPAVFMKAEITSSAFKLMNALNPITIWSMYVLGIGFAKVTELPKTKTLSVVFGLWLLWTLLSAFVKIPFTGG